MRNPQDQRSYGEAMRARAQEHRRLAMARSKEAAKKHDLAPPGFFQQLMSMLDVIKSWSIISFLWKYQDENVPFEEHHTQEALTPEALGLQIQFYTKRPLRSGWEASWMLSQTFVDPATGRPFRFLDRDGKPLRKVIMPASEPPEAFWKRHNAVV